MGVEVAGDLYRRRGIHKVLGMRTAESSVYTGHSLYLFLCVRASTGHAFPHSLGNQTNKEDETNF